MPKGSTQSGLLIAMELGSEWPAGLAGDSGGASRRVVTQLEGETPEAFAARLAGLAGRLFPPRTKLCDAVLACNERTDVAATIARRAIAASLLERLGRRGTLVFAASSRAGGRSRHALSALVADLARTGNVTVHFDGDREATGEIRVARVA